MSTIWILIIFWGELRNDRPKAMTVAEFSSERACTSAIVSAQLSIDRVKAICVAKEIK